MLQYFVLCLFLYISLLMLYSSRCRRDFAQVLLGPKTFLARFPQTVLLSRLASLFFVHFGVAGILRRSYYVRRLFGPGFPRLRYFPVLPLSFLASSLIFLHFYSIVRVIFMLAVFCSIFLFHSLLFPSSLHV